jgi:hypothetical protein
MGGFDREKGRSCLPGGRTASSKADPRTHLKGREAGRKSEEDLLEREQKYTDRVWPETPAGRRNSTSSTPPRAGLQQDLCSMRGTTPPPSNHIRRQPFIHPLPAAGSGLTRGINWCRGFMVSITTHRGSKPNRSSWQVYLLVEKTLWRTGTRVDDLPIDLRMSP